MRIIDRVWKFSSIGLHLIGTVVYGFTISYQEYVNDRRDPRSTLVGDFKYLTYWNLLYQFVFNCLSLWTDLFPNAKYRKKVRDFADGFFFCVATPFSMFVCLSFWTLNTMDKQSVRNPNVNNRFPEWYNHVTHTMNGLMNGLEIMITHHNLPNHKQGILVPIVLYSSYATFMYLLGKFASIWIYPFLGKLDWTQRIIYAVIGGIKLLFYYIVFVYISKFFWPPNRVRKFQQIMG